MFCAQQTFSLAHLAIASEWFWSCPFTLNGMFVVIQVGQFSCQLQLNHWSRRQSAGQALTHPQLHSQLSHQSRHLVLWCCHTKNGKTVQHQCTFVVTCCRRSRIGRCVYYCYLIFVREKTKTMISFIMILCCHIWRLVKTIFIKVYT